MPISPNAQCLRCGHYYSDHYPIRDGVVQRASSRGGDGPCACGGCNAFEQPSAHAKFKILLKWFRKWSKQSKRRTVDRFRGIWNGIDGELTYLTYCRSCKAAVVQNNNASKNLLRRFEGLTCAGCMRCADCCSCKICGMCRQRRRNGYFCPSCNLCVNGCCLCQKCEHCHKQCGGDLCRRCGVCNTCCQCSDLGKVPFLTQRTKFHKSSRAQHKINPTSRFIAAEIEVAEIGGKGKPIYSAVRKWGASIVYDGSLPGTGFEINTAPADGDLFVEQIEEICRELEKSDAYADGRCGLHVHLDARDFSYYDIRRLIKVYADIEEALFAMVPYSRRASRFCLPCGDKLQKTIAIGRLPYEKVKSDIIVGTYNDKSTLERRTNKYEKARYNALNIHSWFYRGTIECRMFDGTINPKHIINWGVLWASILDYVLRSSDEDVAANIKHGESLQNLLKIIGNNTKLRGFIEARTRSYKA